MDHRTAAVPREPQPVRRAGPRAWALGALAGLSAFEPKLTLTYGALVALVTFMTGKPGRFTPRAPELLGALFVAWAWLSVQWAEFPDGTKHAALTFTAAFAMFVGVRQNIASVREMRVILIGYLTGCAIAVFLVLSQDRSDAAGYVAPDRASLEGLNPNYLAYSLSAAGALLVVAWVSAKQTLRRKVLIAAFGAASVVGIYLTGTRGALIGLILLAAWLLVQRAAPGVGLRPMVAGLALVAAGIASGSLDDVLPRLELTRVTGTLGGRLPLWDQARALWGEHPMLGIGAAGFQKWNGLELPTHNTILETGTGLGLVGVVLILLFWWATLGRGTKGVTPRTRVLLLGSFLAASAPSYLSGTWDYAPAAWIVLAIFSRLDVLKRSRVEVRPAQAATNLETVGATE